MPTAVPPPLIGVSTYRQDSAWWAWERDAALVPGSYLDVLQDAGGQPLLIPPPGPGAPDPGAPSRGAPGPGAPDPGDPGPAPGDPGPDPATAVEELIGVLDALVLIGGGDIGADRYGQPADPRNGGTNHQRDDLEFRLLDEALGRDLPVLAVCRGLQVLNVFLGGDLLQQLPDVVGSDLHQPRPGVFGPVTVVSEPGTVVRRLFGRRFEVLCSHHQAVGSLGRDLQVTARSEDGVVEAVELPGRRFVVGVQWHPEESRDVRLFHELVSAARGTRGRRPHPVGGRG